MARIRVTLTVVDTRYPSRGINYDHTDITVSDGVSAPSTQAVNGRESPAWTSEFDVADGPGTVTAQPFDDQGNPIGLPQTATYDATLGTFPAVGAISITLV